MYNIILYNNYSNKIQIKGDLQMLNNETFIKNTYRMLERNEKEIEQLLEKKEEIDKLLSQIYKQNFELIEVLEEVEGK